MHRRPRMLSGSGLFFALSCGVIAPFLVLGQASGVGPTISSIAPVSGAQGSTVTLTGSEFSGSSLAASVGGQSVAVTVTSNTQATFAIPANAPAGSSTITISNGGEALVPTFHYTVFQFTSQVTDAEVGVNYDPRILVTGGTAPYTWSVAAGTLPVGLSFSAAGVFAGTPKAAGSAAITVQATDSAGLSAQFSLAVTVDPGPSITNAALPTATVGAAYSATLAAVGGTPPYQWSINSGPITGGLILSSTGVLSGIPETIATTNVAIRVTDSLGATAVKTFAVVVRPLPQAVTLLTGAGALESTSSFSTPLVSLAPEPGLIGVASSTSGAKTWFVSATGSVVPAVGTASLGGLRRPPRRPVVGIASRPDGRGYWLVTASGHVFVFGAAHNYGSVAERPAGRVVSITSTPSGRGYVIVTAKGHVYTFGNAPRVSSPRPGRLHGSAVGATVTPDGRGVFVASVSGVVLGFGSARKEKIRAPSTTESVTAIVATPTGRGYWLVTGSGSILPAGSAEILPTLAVPPGVVIAAAGSA